ncbi:TetR/AcrR family transcriptional regulator [Paludibaculum fermentans]|uniref:TetR/AcrR family transcriptional regulator n=1 Tax=Paludibaculum fermentans TaxID=1473598 RepID=A0A7S7NQN7_PALFE|nr:TetR/AcrR family transcriptional regulator [Paludibaculum fermentans]QOY88022.1 TetR/AcrR family transcriptional regulator [Paludibaculum fermentans]
MPDTPIPCQFTSSVPEPPLARRRSRRLTGAIRREQVLRIAAGLFTSTGLHGTTTQALADAAGVSEPVLYLHFHSKESLFREAVEFNIQKRLRTLEDRLAVIDAADRRSGIERMAEATVLVCVCGPAHAALLNWALLESPSYAISLYRGEMSAVEEMWSRGLRRWRGVRMAGEFVPRAVEMCLAYGLWLAACGHTAESAAPLARRFTIGLAARR